MDDETKPLYVRLPATTAHQLDIAATAARTSKRQLVTTLIGQGLGSSASSLPVGHASVHRVDTEILTLDETAAALRVDVADVQALVKTGDLPARRIGTEWRVSRRALLAWLAGDVARGAESDDSPQARSGFRPDGTDEA